MRILSLDAALRALAEHPTARFYAAAVSFAPNNTAALVEIIVRTSARESHSVFVAPPVFAELAAREQRLARFAPFIEVNTPSSDGACVPRLMGILNVTPDSFADGGRYVDQAAAVAHARRMMEEGASFIDIGGESTRPGARPVPPHEEVERVVPVIEALRSEAAERSVTLSIDTRHAATMQAALAAGASMINDVTALTGDAQSLAVAASSRADVVLMHMAGEPQTMQQSPHYDNAALDIFDYLQARIAACEAAGIERERLLVDPGVGFGKLLQHNVDILRHLSLYRSLGAKVLLGASRKSFIATLSKKEPAGERLPGSIAVALIGAAAGVSILRVHDVAETAQALAVWSGVARDNEED